MIAPAPSAAPARKVYALKLLREDYGSLRAEGRLIYPVGEWVTAPRDGPGIYCAPAVGGLYDGLTAGGQGHYLAYCEVKGCRDVSTAYPSPSGTMCADALKVVRVVKWAAVDATHQPEWNAVDAKYQPERDAVNAKYRPEWAAVNAKHQTEWDAVDAKYQTEWAAVWRRIVARAKGGAS